MKYFLNAVLFIHCLDAKIQVQPAVDKRNAPPKKTGIVILLTQISFVSELELNFSQDAGTLTFLQFACETLLVGIQMFHIIPPEKYKAFHRGRRGNAMTYLSEVAYICPHIYHSVDICMLCYMC